MTTGNRELDSLVRELSLRQLEKSSDGRRLGHIERLVRTGMGEVQQAQRLLEELVRELEGRPAPATEASAGPSAAQEG